MIFQGGSGGRIINLASVAGFSSMPEVLTDWMGYVMSKWGVVGLTKNFAMAKPSLYTTEGILNNVQYD